MEGLGVAVEADERMPNSSRSPRGTENEAVRATAPFLDGMGCGPTD
jgi:hypothetical protein